MNHNQLLTTIQEKQEEKKTMIYGLLTAICAGSSLAMSIIFYIK